MNDRMAKLERNVRLLQRYAVGMTVAFVVLLAAAFKLPSRTRFAELEVERLNVVEKNGTLRLVIANSGRLAPVTLHGKEYPGLRGGTGEGGAGMIYFNDEGTENGGYLWSGRKSADGSYRAAGFLTFDQYDQDETLTLGYTDANGKRRVGLTVIDEPDTPIQAAADSMILFRSLADTAEGNRRMQQLQEGMIRRGEVRANRLFAGKDPSKTALVSLADPKGRPRLRLSVDSLGVARIEFLNERGEVTDRFPAKS